MNEQLCYRAEESLLENADCVILHMQVGKRGMEHSEEIDFETDLDEFLGGDWESE